MRSGIFLLSMLNDNVYLASSRTNNYFFSFSLSFFSRFFPPLHFPLLPQSASHWNADHQSASPPTRLAINNINQRDNWSLNLTVSKAFH